MKITKLVTLLMISISWFLHAKERVAGTKIKIEAPEDFVKAAQFPGYMMKATGSSIMVTTLPGPFSEVTKGFNKEGFVRQNMKLISKEKQLVGEAQGLLIHASQNARGTSFLKWMLVFGNESETTLVVATFPERFKDELSEKLKKSVLTTEWDRAIKVDFFEGITFRVKESGSLKIANKMGNSLFLSKDGKFPQKNEGEPLVIVGSSITEDWEIPNMKLFSKRRLLHTKGLTVPKILEEKSVKIDGLDGYLIYAKGKGVDGDLYIEQCLLFTEDGYYIFQALVGNDKKDKYVKDFRIILNSFKEKK